MASRASPAGEASKSLQVVPGDDPGQLRVVLALQVLCHGEVPGAPGLPAEPTQGDIADQALEESILASLDRPRVTYWLDQLSPAQRMQKHFDFGGVLSGENRETGDVEGLSEHGGILDECPFFSTEPVETSADDGLEGFRDDQLGQVADDPIIPGFARQLPLSEQASQQLDCIEGDACGALHDGLGRRLWDSGNGAMYQREHVF